MKPAQMSIFPLLSNTNWAQRKLERIMSCERNAALARQFECRLQLLSPTS